MAFVDDIMAEVREKYPEIDFPYARKEPIWYGRRQHHRAESKMGIIVDYKDEEHLAYVASDVSNRKYEILQYEEIIWHAEKAMAKLEEYGTPTANIQLLQDGNKFIFELKFNECAPITIREGQQVTPNIKIKSSHDGMWEPSFTGGAIVLVCTNGLTIGKSAFSDKKKHGLGLSISAMVENMKIGMMEFADETGIWKHWAERQLTAPDWVEIQEKLPFGKKQLPEVLALPMDGVGYSLNETTKGNVPPNLWDVAMASTQYLRDLDSPIVRMTKTDQVMNLLRKY
jgi:hypothetical protein